MVYLDNAATTKPSQAVLSAVTTTLGDLYANPSSLHSGGLAAKRTLEDARKTIADALCADKSEVCFTGSGTEANNIALLGLARARKNFGDHIVVTAYEHASVRETALSLKKEGFSVTEIKPGRDGKIDPDEFVGAISKTTAVASAMQINNETGARINILRLAEAVKQANRRTAFHCDAVQGFLKYPLPLAGSAVDSCAVSGHKVHAPKGIGALYLRKGLHIEPVYFGGGQERGMRSGTENVAFAVGFAEAALRTNIEQNKRHVETLHALLRQLLLETDGVAINSPEDGSAYLLSFSIPGYRSETLTRFLDAHGFQVSAASACSGLHKSRTLQAMGIGDARLDSAIRVGLCEENAEEDIRCFAECIKTAIRSLAHRGENKG